MFSWDGAPMTKTLRVAVSWGVCCATVWSQATIPPTAPRELPPKNQWVSPRGTVGHPAGASCHSEVVRGAHRSIQVNVDEKGCNIVGDAANEPSIAVSATDPRKIVIGWRQFNSVSSDFREAGWAYSHDGGHTWVFRGSLDPGVFGTDPVLAAGPEGEVYYLSLGVGLRLFKSFDGGTTWPQYTQISPFFLDKPWITTDLSNGPGRGHIYVANVDFFSRSTDGGGSFNGGYGYFPLFPTMSVDPWGNLFMVGDAGCAMVSYSVQWEMMLPIFFEVGCVSCSTNADLETTTALNPNPEGLLDQT